MINFTTLFTRLGKIGSALNIINTAVGTTVPTAANVIASEYTANPEMVPTLQSDLLNSYSQYSGYEQQLQGYAQNTVIQTIGNDTPQSNASVNTALQELVLQMDADGQSISQNTVGYTTTPYGGNNGNGSVVCSMLNPSGWPLPFPFAEDVVITCTSDSFTGGATAGFEGFNAQGVQAVSAPLSFQWPGGSGANFSFNSISPTNDNTGLNLLTNGDFATAVPSLIQIANWTLHQGSTCTDFNIETADVYGSPYGAAFEPTGNNVEFVQEFGESSGTKAVLQPLTQYAVSFWLSTAPSSMSTGTFSVRLWDEDANAIMEDADSNPNTQCITVSGLNTTFTQHFAVFRTPRIMPNNYRLSFLAHLSSNRVVLEYVCMARMNQLYPGGPWINIAAGDFPFVKGDGFILSVTNSYNSAWATFNQRVFGLNSSGIILPSSGSPTISDSLL